MTMRILCLKATRLKTGPKAYGDLDAHHEYYLEDDQARDLIDKGFAVELDGSGRRVERSAGGSTAQPKRASEVQAGGTEGKPGSGRRTKATAPPENKGGSESGG